MKKPYKWRDAKKRRHEIYKVRKHTDFTLAEIGEMFDGITAERVRQIVNAEKRAIELSKVDKNKNQ